MTQFDHPPLTTCELAHLALRYAANDLTAPDLRAFEARLCDDQEAREALAEAIRLSAAASGIAAPLPHTNLADDIAEQVNPTWLSRLFPRQRYRGHPGLWATAGALAVGTAALTLWAFSPPNQVDYAQQLVTTPQTQQLNMPLISPESVVVTRREGTEYPKSKLNPMGLHEKHPNTQPSVPMEPLSVGRMAERHRTQPANKPDIAESGHPSNEAQPSPITESATKKL